MSAARFVGAAVFLAAAIAPLSATAQDAQGTQTKDKKPIANFTGVLRERGTRAPLSGLVVTIYRTEDGRPVGFEATSDANGAFAFYELPSGTWNVLVEAPGYLPFETAEEIVEGEAIQAGYYVERGSYNPYDVTVTGVRVKKEVSRTSLAAHEIEKVPGVAGDPLGVIQSFPGVARSQFASGQLIVRGSAPEDTRVFVDGAEVPLVYHFGGLRSVVPMAMLDAIDFYPGNFPVAYGRATGGMIDVKLKKLAPKRFGGSLDVSLLDASLYLEAPIGEDAAVAIAGRRSYVGEVLDLLVPEDTLDLVIAPRYYDAQLLASYRPAPAHDLRLMLLGSDDRMELLFANPADLDPALAGNRFSSSERFYRAQALYRFAPSTRFENTLRVSFGQSFEEDAFAQVVIDVDTDTVQARDTARYELGEAAAISVGADVLANRHSGFVRAPLLPKEGEQGSFDLTRIFARRFTTTEFSPAVFTELELRPVRPWLLVPGVRVDHFGGIGDTLVQPRFSTRFAAAPFLTTKAAVGLYAQEPTVDERVEPFGNPALEAERAIHYSAGFEAALLPHLTLDATAFYKQLTNLVSRADRVETTGDDPGASRFDNGGEGRVYGAELVLKHAFANHFSGWLAYTISRSERQDSGKPGERLFDYDQTHILALLGTYALPRNWEIGARFRFVSGNPRTPVTGAVFNASADRYDPIYGAPNSDRNPPFHQLDVRVDKRWVFDAWMLSAYLEVQNVYNRANPEGLSYRYDYRRSTVQQGLPLLPILGARADF